LQTLEQKKQVVAEIKDDFSKAQSVTILQYRGLTVSEMTELRAKFRASGVKMKVLKNTLVKRAADDYGIAEIDQLMEGPTAWAFSLNDPVAAPKIVTEFIKDHPKLEIKGGILEKKVINVDGVKALANLPSREVLLAQVLAGMQAPLVGMANVLQGPLRKWVYVLEAVRKAKEQA
jgi:large subunit ribosomal protein L10